MKNPENLTVRQRKKLAWVAKSHPRLHRAYLLKEGLRLAFQLKGQAGKDAIDRWISWARRCRIDAFVELQRRIVKNRTEIDAALDHGLSQGLIESTNTKNRVLTRIAFGLKSLDALIALAMLALGGYRPDLPHQHPPDDPRKQQDGPKEIDSLLDIATKNSIIVRPLIRGCIRGEAIGIKKRIDLTW